MPVPQLLTDQSLYRQVWDGMKDVATNPDNSSRAFSSKHFYAYLEIYEQSAHDAALATLLAGKTRSPHKTQVSPANNKADPLPYYDAIGEVAAEVVSAEMTKRWVANTTNNAVFALGQKYGLGVQGKKQRNGFQYDITMWYGGSDVYLAFHCYNP